MNGTVRGKPALRGHEKFLSDLRNSEADIFLMEMGGEGVLGKILHFDNYTITVAVVISISSIVPPENRVYFKHAIKYIKPLTPRPGKV